MVPPPDEFDFYPCLVDDAPGSIYVNMAFADEPPPDTGTRYTLAVRMREAGEYGIGTEAEAAALNLVEEAVIARAVTSGVTYVGRVRTGGVWEIVLYGPEGRLEVLRDAAKERAGDRRMEARSANDLAWTYYRELLLPDAERRQWMDDRRMVQILAEQGDRSSTPRRVDHHLVFPSAAQRDAFVSAVAPSGFTSVATEDDHAHVHRADAVELVHIHEVVMTLVDAAAPLGGSYLRWEAGIES